MRTLLDSACDSAQVMKYYFRLLWLILTQSRRSRCSMLGPVDTHLRVMPNDLDALLHVNNGVYLTLMDLGRIDLMLRCNAYHAVRKKGWYPVAAGETIRFKRSLKLFQQFTIRTSVVGWDERSVYLQQQFISKDQLVANAVVDARFLKKTGGDVSPHELLVFLGIDQKSPPLPDWVATWVQSNRQMTMEIIDANVSN